MDFTNYNLELKRKIFHCLSIVFPILYFFVSKLTIIIVLMLFTGAVLTLDISRHYNVKIQGLVDKFFTSIMRPEEISGSFKLSGASYMFLGFFISAVLFSKGTAISAFLVLIVSDSAAAIIGKQVGTPLKNGKTVEGCIAFGMTAFLIGMLSYTFQTYTASFMSIIVASVIATLVEYHSSAYKINDNIAIPISYGLVISLWGLFI